MGKDNVDMISLEVILYRTSAA